MALTAVEKMATYRQRLKDRKQLLDDKGLIEISLIVTKDQVLKIKAVAKMMKINEAKLLHVVTQPAIIDLCQRHDDIFIRRHEEQDRLCQEWCDNNPELLKELLNSEV